jgi:raffinose/stachyose/melibiose transport system permease protein
MAQDAATLPGLARLDRAQARRPRRGATRWVVLAILIVALFATVFPFLVALVNAVKTGVDYAQNGPAAWPHSFSLATLGYFWNETNYTRKLINSVVISGIVAIAGVILSLLNAYAIGIGKVKGGKVALVLLLMGIMVPQESLVYPLYFMAKSVDLYDTIWSVIIIFSVLQSAFGTYLLAAVLTAFPREIIEAAEIDGASRFQVLWHVVVPVLRPTLAVLATFFFIWTWNEFLLPLVLLISNDNQTVSVAMGVLQGQNTTAQPNLIAAASLLGILPTIIFFLIFQRTLTKGVVVGAVK